jgi:hypothetical protein
VIMMGTIIKNAKFLCSVFLLFSFVPVIYGFELLSEGAMDSVSVRSGPILESRLSDSELADGYEPLPISTSARVNVSDTDEVSVDLNFVLTQEVESWANNVRDRGDILFEVNTIDVLPGADTYDFHFELGHAGIEILDAKGDETGKVTYQRGDTSHSTNIIDASINSITVEHSSYVERAATIDANPYQDGSSFGSTYLSDIRASSWHRTTLRD